MKKTYLIPLFLLVLLTCSKNGYSKTIQDTSKLKIEGATFLNEISFLSLSADVDIVSQYRYSSISNMYKACRVTATFADDDEPVEVEVNKQVLSKSEKYPKKYRHVGKSYQAFNEVFKDLAGQVLPIKITKSTHFADFSTSLYLPKTQKFEVNYNKDANNVTLDWMVDPNINNNFMVVDLGTYIGEKRYSLKFDYQSGHAVVDLNSLEGFPKNFHLTTVDFMYGMSFMVETPEKKKIKVTSIILNSAVFYQNHFKK